MIKVRYSDIEMSDGTKITLPPAGVVIFVGPNNAGKSQSLKDLRGHVQDGAYSGRAIRRVTINKEGSRDDIDEWARSSLSWHERDGISRAHVDGWGEVAATDIANQWDTASPLLSVLTDSLVLFADGTTRLTAGNAPKNLDFRRQPATHPIQRASRSPKLERAFHELSMSAFSLGVTVDRFSGSVIPLRLGPRPEFRHEDGMPTDEYLADLSSLAQLEEQGDGVKGYLGLMIQLVAGSHQVLLVDEPEAFLHPPQARLLGRSLAERASDRQVFISTHSADIVRGALESDATVTIIRLRRNGSSNEAAVLDDAAVKQLWSDPLLRYSEVLSGLFHDAVVVCEADSDCRYFAAVRDQLFPDGGAGGRRPELLFTYCGGKARLPVVIRALRAVRVPVIAIADFDVLREEHHIRGIYNASGGDWSQLETTHKVLSSDLQSGAKSASRTAVREAVLRRLDEAEELLTKADIEDVKRILKVENGWDRVKSAGLAAVPQGAAATAADTLLSELQERNVLVVPVGELERFEPSVAGHGPVWVNEVLSQGRHENPGKDARDFLGRIEAVARHASGLGSVTVID